jgi:tetratricopeptide (TPR) repeat protein
MTAQAATDKAQTEWLAKQLRVRKTEGKTGQDALSEEKMHRSALKTGMRVHRSRASTRRRDRAEEPAHSPNLSQQLQAWLVEHVRLVELEDIKVFDRKRFLQETGQFNIAPGERLRQLAIHVEFTASGAKQPEGWCVLRSIYEQALRFNEAHGWLIHNSMTISALECVYSQDEQPVRERIAADGIKAGEIAVTLAPESPQAQFWLGRLYYETDLLVEALRCAEAGVAADPTHALSAELRANCLGDLERWEEAIRAYDAVPLDFFKGANAWRVDWLKQCRAWCRLQLGDREGALEDFIAILSRYQAQPALAVRLFHLTDAAAVPLRKELHERTLALVRQLGRTGYINQLEVVVDRAWLCWNSGAVVQIAQSICDDNAFDQLPILADALEEAGCNEPRILAHCREDKVDRKVGSWVVGFLLRLSRLRYWA